MSWRSRRSRRPSRRRQRLGPPPSSSSRSPEPVSTPRCASPAERRCGRVAPATSARAAARPAVAAETESRPGLRAGGRAGLGSSTTCSWARGGQVGTQPADHHQHAGHGHEGAGRPGEGHGHQPPARGRELTGLAVSATLHCLTGCAIGEVLGLVLATWWGWSNSASIVLAIVLAFFFGYSLTIIPVLRSGIALKTAIGVALAADTVSILTMEIVDNAVVLAVPGAMEAGLTDWLFWASLALSLLVAFAITVPVNRALIARGRGHAVVHQYHH